jgi:Tfp pilus assembly protein PilF
MGVLKHQRGEAEAAVDLIGRSIAIAPRHPDAHNNLGNVYREAGQPEKARESYERAGAAAMGHDPEQPR